MNAKKVLSDTNNFLFTFIPMKEQVTDISKVLQGITEDMRLMRETINQQYSEIKRINFHTLYILCHC